MSAHEDDQLLRSVALQNAQSILLARQKAEEELLRAKEALEGRSTELAHTLAMIRATLDSTTDGILVTDGDRRVTDFNRKYVAMWQIPREALESREHDKLLEVCGEQAKNPDAFIRRVREIYATAPAETYDVLELVDGRVYERFSRIQYVHGQDVGRVWSFRDITERRRAEETITERLHLSALRAEIASVLAENQPLHVILQRCAELIVHHLRAAFARIWTLNDAENVLELQASAGMYTHLDGPHSRIKVGEFKIGQIAQERLPHLTNHVAEDLRISDREWARREGIVAFAGYPLLLEGRCIGVLALFARHALSVGILADLGLLADGIAQCVQRKRADEDLRASESRKAAILQTALDAIVTCDHTGIILEFNPAAERIFGFRREEVLGKNMADLIVPVYLRQQHRDGMARYLATGEGPVLNRRIEMTALHANGHEFPVELAIIRIPGEGWPVFTAHVRDITDRRQAENALREQSEWLRVTLSSIGDAVITTDADGRVTSMNAVAESLTGWTGQEAVGVLLDTVLRIVDVNREPIENPARQVLSEGRTVGRAGHTILIGRNGVERAISNNAAPIRDARGNVLGVVLVIRDVTEDRRAEAALQKAGQVARFLAGASAALAELTDYESTLRRIADLAVPAFADWCAVDIQEPDGTVRRLASTHSDPAKVDLAHELHGRYPPRPSDTSGVMKVLRTGEPDWAAEVPDSLLVESARDEGHLRMLRELGLRSYISVPINSGSRTLGVLTFVTAESQRTYEANDVRAAEDLADRAAVAVENASLLEAMREADRRKDEFLAMLAHELRNPLAPIRNGLQVLKLADANSDAAAQARTMMERQVNQMVRLVDDLLDVGRITRNKLQLRKQPVTLSEVINSAIETSLPLIEQWGHVFTVTLTSAPVWLEADSVRLAQVFSNLLNNSAKYTEPGGKIELMAELNGAEVVVRVKDTGLGIPAAALPHIFDLFSQVGQHANRSQGGLGIGLTLVRRLVEMHGGKVQAHSGGPNQGSEFVVRLPILRAERATASGCANDHSLATERGCRILVVDDNHDSAMSLAMILQLMGNETRIAEDGVAAVEAAARFRPEIILLDIGLPRLNGYDVCRRIRDQAWGKDLVLVAVTGWGQEEDRLKSREAGFDYHFVKPIDPHILIELLADLRRRQGLNFGVADTRPEDVG